MGNGQSIFRIEQTVSVNVNPDRDLHGPSVVRASNGDLLLCHQDSEQHLGGDGYVHQWRSTDDGFTWQDEGPAADWRDRSIDALFGECGKTPDGRLVMFVQRRRPRGDDDSILGCWYSVSSDNGRTWIDLGPVDGSDEFAVMSVRNVLTRESVMYCGVWSRRGSALYVSGDNGGTWHKRSTIFPTTYPGFETLKNAGPPFYPHAVFCPDGSLLAMTYYTPPRNHCYSRRSRDNGQRWDAIRAETDLKVWAPRMKVLDNGIIVVTGRDIREHATVALFSHDGGRSWGNKVTVDSPAYPGSYAYTDSITLDEDTFWVFTSSPQSEGRGDIIGVLLRRTDGSAGCDGRVWA